MISLFSKNTMPWVLPMGLRFKEDWSEVENRFSAWWEGELREPLIQIIASRKGRLEDLFWRDSWGFAKDPHHPERTIQSFMKWCNNVLFLGDAYPNLWVNLGPGIMAGYLGAKVVVREDTVWFGASADENEARDWEDVIEMLYFNDKSFWWNVTLKITEACLVHGVGSYITGLTDLGGIHDILASLRGMLNLLRDLHLNPSKVEEASWKILDLWHIYYERLYHLCQQHMRGTSAWMGLWSPKRWYPIQCDFSALISPKHFKRFVLPIIAEQCERLDHIIYHLDGPGEIPHLDYLLKVDNLHGIQWVPGARMDAVGKHCGSEYWLPMYRKILKAGKRLVIAVPYSHVISILRALPTTRGVLIQTMCVDRSRAEELLEHAKSIAH